MNHKGYLNEFDIFEKNGNHTADFYKVQVLDLEEKNLDAFLKQPIYLKSLLFLLVLEGRIEVIINYQTRDLSNGELLLLSYGHLIEIDKISTNFKCLVLYISFDFIGKMYNSEMLNKKIKYSVQLYNSPILTLKNNENNTLIRRFGLIEEMIKQKDHLFYKELIFEALQIFFLDLSSYIETRTIQTNDYENSNVNVYFQKYIDLLLSNFKEEQNVDFYAKSLHITPQYLNKITKKIVGETVTKMIENLLFAEARSLLKYSKLSIKEISEELKFSDQSAFGKFFKRISTISPLEYRRENRSYTD